MLVAFTHWVVMCILTERIHLLLLNLGKRLLVFFMGNIKNIFNLTKTLKAPFEKHFSGEKSIKVVQISWSLLWDSGL